MWGLIVFWFEISVRNRIKFKEILAMIVRLKGALEEIIILTSGSELRKGIILPLGTSPWTKIALSRSQESVQVYSGPTSFKTKVGTFYNFCRNKPGERSTSKLRSTYRSGRGRWWTDCTSGQKEINIFTFYNKYIVPLDRAAEIVLSYYPG